MSLYHVYADYNELLNKGHELIDQFNELSQVLKNRSGKNSLQKARIIENIMNLHFWHEEHIQAYHLYEDMTKHINEHLSISAALKNFITALELNLITSDNIDYFEKNIVQPYKNHLTQDDKKFISYISTKKEVVDELAVRF